MCSVNSLKFNELISDRLSVSGHICCLLSVIGISAKSCIGALLSRTARCMALEIQRSKGNHIGFTKLLFRRQFTHYAMAIPFILHSLPCSSTYIPLVRCESYRR